MIVSGMHREDRARRDRVCALTRLSGAGAAAAIEGPAIRHVAIHSREESIWSKRRSELSQLLTGAGCVKPCTAAGDNACEANVVLPVNCRNENRKRRPAMTRQRQSVCQDVYPKTHLGSGSSRSLSDRVQRPIPRDMLLSACRTGRDWPGTVPWRSRGE